MILIGSLVLAGVMGAPATATVAQAQDASSSRPNVLFIMSDDHAAHAIGAYGSRLAALNPTPTLDRLAQEGMRFGQAFVANSICTPARATVLTGQHSHVNGVRILNDPLPVAQQHLPRLAGEAGYETAVIGKWHLVEEPGAFDHYAVMPGQGSYFNPLLHVKGEGEWPDNQVRFGGNYNSQHESDVITDLSLEWLENRDRSRPFFLMHQFKAPHDNFENAERYDFLYDDVYIPEPASLWHQPDHGSLATEGAGTSVGKRNQRRNMGQHMFVDPNLDDDAYKRTAYQRYLKKYLRTVRGLDDNVARLLEYLEETGELGNTVVVYTSDQGMMLGEHDYIDKRWMYEESMRMPLIVRYPGVVEPGSFSDALVNNLDFAPTLLELIGVPIPDYMQGRSLVPILGGETPGDWREVTYYRYWMNMVHHDVPAHYGIRTKDYKLIFFYALPLDVAVARPRVTQPGWELYDLRLDPEELRNVYDDPRYQDVVKRLKRELLAEKERVGDLDEIYPDLMDIRREYWN